jgi:hypothetical protein
LCGIVVSFLELSLLCTEAKSDTVTLSYNLRVDTAECIDGSTCSIPFTPFLEIFTVTFDPFVPVVDPTTVGLDIISINRPYSSAFTYSITQTTDGEFGTLTVATLPGPNGSCFAQLNIYCTNVNVNPLSPYPALHPGGVLEITSTGEIWTGQNVIPEPSTWAMMLVGFAGLGLAGYRRAKALGPMSASLAD